MINARHALVGLGLVLVALLIVSERRERELERLRREVPILRALCRPAVTP